jgi:asparagine synthetase A
VAGDQQDNDALEAIKSIFRESVDREKILTQREKSLEVRESLLTSTYYANLEKVSEAEPTPTFVNDEELVEENRNLKAEVYELRASQRRGCKPQIIAEAVKESGSATHNSDGESDKYSIDGEYDDNESGDGIEKRKKHKAEKGTDVVKLDRREYETLLKNLSELEVRLSNE